MNDLHYVSGTPDHCTQSFIRTGLACYNVYGTTKTWFEARYWCQEQGGDLAVFDSSVSEEQLMSDQPLWVGLTYRKWQWINGRCLYVSKICRFISDILEHF